MPVNNFTGSEESRYSEIQNRWLVFEPLSSERFSISDNLYTVPIGQTFASQIKINSGSVPTLTGVIPIEKEIHVFEDENEAVDFINNYGPENVVSYSESEVDDIILGKIKFFEIHVVNYPIIDFEFELLDGRNEKGFVIEPFISGSIFSTGSIDLEPVTREIVFSKENKIISDTYLRYFCFNCADAGSGLSDNTQTPTESETNEPLGEEGVL